MNGKDGRALAAGAASATTMARALAAAATRLPWRRVARALLWLALAATGLAAAAVVYLALTLPVPDDGAASDDQAAAPQPSLLLEAADGRPFAARGSSRPVPVPLSELPRHLIDAIVAVEDRRFYAHPGIDPKGLARAVVANVSSGRASEGASTITQQLARLTFLSREKTVARKLQEALLALWLEARLTKDEILERYLNAAYFGAGANGVQAASQRYFGKPARDVTLAEAAMLAGLVQAPSVYAPTRDLEAARGRAGVVLNAMADAGRLGGAEAEAAKAAPASLAVPPESTPGQGYYVDWAADEARRLLGPVAAEFALGTTLDADLQALAERVVAERLAAEGERKSVSQAALVALAHDGAVLAMVGGRDHKESQFNRATQARRQPGSLFKLFVFAEALNAGLTPDSGVVDEPIRVGDWEPENHGRRFRGRITLREAFAESVNTVAVRLGQDLGVERVAGLARAMGVASPLDPNPSLVLGTSGVTLLEMTAAYAAVAASRAKVEPYAVRSVRAASAPGRAGQTFYARQPLQPPAPDEPLPYKRREVLDLLLAAVRAGTAEGAALGRPAAGKTGTTQDYRDAWFVGMTADAVVGVWVGNDDNAPTKGVTGGDLPAAIWRDFMREADALKGAAPPREPPPAAEEAAAAAAAAARPADLEVIDTGTIRFPPRTVVRLEGVAGLTGRHAADLQAYLRGREVACEPVPRRATHRCRVTGGPDLAELVVANGAGKAARDASAGLRQAEREARARGRGVWGR